MDVVRMAFQMSNDMTRASEVGPQFFFRELTDIPACLCSKRIGRRSLKMYSTLLSASSDSKSVHVRGTSSVRVRANLRRFGLCPTFR